MSHSHTSNTLDSGTPAPASTDRPDRKAAIEGLANTLKTPAVSPGDRAALRRLSPDSFNAPAYWRLLLSMDERLRPPAQEPRWAMLMAGMEQVPHVRGRRPGAVLAEAGWSDQRLEQLLQARDIGQFWPLFRRLCQFLSAKGETVDWTVFSGLLFAPPGDTAEQARRTLARDYYATQARHQAAAQ